jgi:hypothetical protein
MMHSIKQQYQEFDLHNQEIAEIGSGKYLAHPIGLKLLGANRITSFDLHRQFNQKAASIAYLQQVMAKKIYSSNASPEIYLKIMEDIKSTNMDLDKLHQMGINYLAPYDLREYSTNNKFYLVISYTVLEHIPPNDINSLLEKSIDIISEGGYFCHYIDLEDHLNPTQAPFDFFKENDWSDKDCFSRGNRLRISDWTELFDKISGIDYEFITKFKRDASLLPMDINKLKESEIENYVVSGILVVGRKHR